MPKKEHFKAKQMKRDNFHKLKLAIIWTELLDINQQARSNDFISVYIAQEDSQSKKWFTE